ncbi:hypothetical protein HDU97_009340 [Phlyctochytrium planicorne]|nr:hypothetical protein HDU97_009340 [Phlyctochytrium planicorne]
MSITEQSQRIGETPIPKVTKKTLPYWTIAVTIGGAYGGYLLAKKFLDEYLAHPQEQERLERTVDRAANIGGKVAKDADTLLGEER